MAAVSMLSCDLFTIDCAMALTTGKRRTKIRTMPITAVTIWHPINHLRL